LREKKSALEVSVSNAVVVEVVDKNGPDDSDDVMLDKLAFFKEPVASSKTRFV